MSKSIRANNKPCSICKVNPRLYTSYCKECHRAKSRAWAQQNAEKVRERQRNAYHDKKNGSRVKQELAAKLMILSDVAHNTPADYDLCITWPGFKTHLGYGQVWYDGKAQYVHRLVLEHKLERKIKKGFETLHSCDNSSCINPNHLSEGTHKQNMAEASQRGRLNNVGKRKTKYSDEEKAEVRRLYSEGWSIWKIACDLGIPYATALFIAKSKQRKAA